MADSVSAPATPSNPGVPQGDGNAQQPSGCRFCAKTKNLKNHNSSLIQCSFDVHADCKESGRWCSACQTAWNKHKKKLKHKHQTTSNSSSPGPESVGVKRQKHSSSDPPEQQPLQTTAQDTSTDATSASSRIQLSSLSHSQLLIRSRNLCAERTRQAKQIQRLEQQNTEYLQELVALRQAAGGTVKAAKDRELVETIDKAETLMEGEGFKHGTFFRIALAMVIGILAPRSVEVHHLGDLGRNIHNPATSAGWRWSDLHKRFWSYICLISRRAYRAVRGGEGLRPGRHKHLSVSSLNMIVPGVRTMGDAAHKADPDPNFRDGLGNSISRRVQGGRWMLAQQ